jgi:hypothetical protein
VIHEQEAFFRGLWISHRHACPISVKPPATGAKDASNNVKLSLLPPEPMVIVVAPDAIPFVSANALLFKSFALLVAFVHTRALPEPSNPAPTIQQPLATGVKTTGCEAVDELFVANAVLSGCPDPATPV